MSLQFDVCDGKATFEELYQDLSKPIEKRELIFQEMLKDVA